MLPMNSFDLSMRPHTSAAIHDYDETNASGRLSEIKPEEAASAIIKRRPSPLSKMYNDVHQ